ncbi:copper transport protein [Paenibacillus sp. DS2015]|uniref:copper resistance CopC/CopD family protein n=1 Tax=Paenibacillus sp. DS2015 TaxID=3373917 RepID=UPI003D1DA28C
MNKIKKLLCLGIIVFAICLLLLPTPTYAHAFLQQSNPSENEVLTESPAQVTLQFNEPIQPAFHSIQVINPAGDRVDQDNTHVAKDRPSVLEVSVNPDLADGIYMIAWKAISGDGHPIEGTFPFQMGNSGGEAGPTTPITSSDFPRLDLIVIRWLLYLSMSFFIGIVCFYLFMYPANPKGNFLLPQRSRFLLWTSYIGIALSLLLSLPLQTTIDARIGWSQVWSTVWLGEMIQHTSFGTVWIVQLLLIILMCGALVAVNRNQLSSRFRKNSTFVALVLGFGILLSKAFIGHAPTTDHQTLSILMDFIHLAAVSIWLGSLLALAAILPGEASLPTYRPDRKKVYFAVIRNFSRWGTILVLLLVISGIYASLQYIPTVYALFHTLYGQVLLMKSGLLLMMIGFAAFNLFRGKQMNKQLNRSIWIELSIGIIALVLSAVLSNLPTGMASPGPVQQSYKLDNGYRISLEISPNVTGNNLFEVNIHNAAGQEFTEIQQIRLTLTSLDMDMGKYEIIIPNNASTPFRKEDLISMAGRWNAQVHVLTNSLESWDATFTFRAGTD